MSSVVTARRPEQRPPVRGERDAMKLYERLTERASKWREVLAGDTPLARQALRALMAGPI
jgi:hypothetical protein